MTKGSCFCSKVKYTFTGEPAMQAICHCLECQKVSGSAFTTNIIIPSTAFTIDAGAENLKTFGKKHESGMILSIHFCSNCGSTVYKDLDGGSYKGLLIVQAGTLDEGMKIDDVKLGAELWVSHRVPWLHEMKGLGQCQTFS